MPAGGFGKTEVRTKVTVYAVSARGRRKLDAEGEELTGMEERKGRERDQRDIDWFLRAESTRLGSGSHGRLRITDQTRLEEPVEGEEEVLDVLVEEGALQVGAVDLRRPQALVLPVCMHARGQGEGKGSYVSGLPETCCAERKGQRTTTIPQDTSAPK